MKIVACVRTRDEERNIARWIHDYWWADEILIADGGSKDATVSVANTFKHVKVRNFDMRVDKHGIWRNPEGQHANFLFDWARNENADWILFDDCDAFPTASLQDKAREFFEQAESYEKLYMMAYHIYIYNTDRWFPDLNKPGQAIWGWKANSGIYAEEVDPWMLTLSGYQPDENHSKYFYLEYPYSKLHFYTLTDEVVKRKMSFYSAAWSLNFPHYLESCGVTAPLEDWMVDV